MTRTKIALAVAAFVAVVAGAAPSARAQIPVTDVGNLTQNTTTALKTAAILENTYRAARAAADANQQPAPDAQEHRPDDASRGCRRCSLKGSSRTRCCRAISSSIGYNIAAVNRGFDQMFPKSQTQWRNAQYSDFGNYYDRWNAEVTTASKAAVRAQSTISTIDADNRAMADILRQSNSSSTGQVRLAPAHQPAARSHPQGPRLGRPEPRHHRPRAHELERRRRRRADDGPRAIAAPPRRLHQPRPGAARPQPSPLTAEREPWNSIC